MVVANGDAPQADETCRITVIRYLRALQQSGVIVLDDAWLILNEYTAHASVAGQPGVGDAFLRFLLQNLGVAERCRLVPITPHEAREFVEFPDDPALAGFDRSDRKFAAVALASVPSARVVNAVDSDWWTYRNRLRVHGLEIDCLCPVPLADGRRAAR